MRLEFFVCLSEYLAVQVRQVEGQRRILCSDSHDLIAR